MKFIVENHAGERLDVFVSGKLPNISRAKITKAIRGGDVLLNGERAKPSVSVADGDEIMVDMRSLSKKMEIKREKLDFQIVYEDNSLLVVNKPAGMVVHPTASGQHLGGTVVNAILGKVSFAKGELRPGIVHRLDKDTSGLLIVAKNEKALKILQGKFKKREIEKTYIALVCGIPDEASALIEAPMERSVRDPRKMVVSFRAGAKEARTSYEILEKFRYGHETFALLKVRIFTGRTHQIRVHMASIGFPVAGDKMYGKKSRFPFKRQFLHASAIKFVSPDTKKTVKLNSELPDDLREVIKLLEQTSS